MTDQARAYVEQKLRALELAMSQRMEMETRAHLLANKTPQDPDSIDHNSPAERHPNRAQRRLAAKMARKATR